MSEETSRAIITLGAVALGWLLGTFTGLFRELWTRRRIRRAMIQEIQDIRFMFLEAKPILEEALRITLQTGVYDGLPHQTPTHIYTNHFHVIAPHLKLGERFSFNRIYSLVEVTNQQYRLIAEAFEGLRFAPESDELGAKYSKVASLIQGAYYNVCNAIIGINHHVEHKNDVPGITQKDQDELDAQIASNIDEIKKIAATFPDRAKFENPNSTQPVTP